MGVAQVSKPKILFLDIETAPDLAYVWGVYEQNAIEVKEHWYILSYAARWGKGPIFCEGLDDVGGKDDYKLVKRIHALLEEADIVVAHNGVDFDIKKINARLIAQGFTPPAPYKVVDTKREIKKVAAFSSNKLDWLCRQLSLGRKLQHEGFEMWKGCMAGDRKAWKKMKKYNKHDIKLLSELYALISPWIRQPNASMWSPGRCVNPNCGSTDLESRGFAYTTTRVYPRFQCRSCGKWCRGVASERKTGVTA